MFDSSQNDPLLNPPVELFSVIPEGFNGSTHVLGVKSIYRELLAISEPGINFNESKIDEGNGYAGTMEGGTCTAMSLEFIDRYMEITERVYKLGLHRLLLPIDLDLFVLTNICCLEKNFLQSSEIMRTRQAAYNTIEVTDRSSNIDHTKNKVQSIANLYKFKIDYSSPELDVITEMSSPDQLSPHIAALPNGIFIIRLLKPSDNEKLEEYGHSAVYINEPSFKVFYDPSKGATHWSIDKVSENFFDVFKKYLQSNDLSKVRFFHIQETQS